MLVCGFCNSYKIGQIVVLDQLIPEEVGEIKLFQLAEGQGFAVEQPEGIATVLESNVE